MLNTIEKMTKNFFEAEMLTMAVDVVDKIHEQRYIAAEELIFVMTRKNFDWERSYTRLAATKEYSMELDFKTLLFKASNSQKTIEIQVYKDEQNKYFLNKDGLCSYLEIREELDKPFLHFNMYGDAYYKQSNVKHKEVTVNEQFLLFRFNYIEMCLHTNIKRCPNI